MTIEERGKQLASIQGGISEYGKKVIEKCCIQIATEQRKIDIEKAWDWILMHTNAMPGDAGDFIKTMEEER